MKYNVKEIILNERIIDFWEKSSNKIMINSSYEWYMIYSEKISSKNVCYGLFENYELISIATAFIIDNIGVNTWHNCFTFYNNSNDFNYSKISFVDKREEDLLPYMILTSPFGYTNDFISQRNLSEKEIIFFINGILKSAKLKGMKMCSFLWQEDSDQVKLKAMNKCRLIKNFMGCNHYLEIDNFNSFNDYMNSLKKKRSKNIKRERKIFSQNKFEVKLASLTEKKINILINLKRNLNEKYNYNQPISFIKKEINFLLKHPNSMLFELYKLNILVGYLIGFLWNNCFYCVSIGFDYENINEGYCYFNVLYYLIEYLIENTNVKRIYFGGGALEAKLSRGFKPISYLGYYKFFDNNLNWFKKDIEEYGKAKLEYYNYMYYKFLA